MSLDQLKKLQRETDAAIKSYQDRERKKAIAAIEAKAQEMGFSLSELTGGAVKSRKVNPPKYRNPQDATQTWSGRGRQPGWVKEILASEGDLDACLIS
ncbi:H-NS family nucleoid-associated regulatory protein [Pseudooceanicola nanhaiensis]|uniref:H-NS histone family protein n=1 Tax=Pseudooceanicola nanhaiensis TaxID=375761 RepID=UPI001CD23CD8|nr:H-NS histone family protein [Pseudooceanicola nanhaiensis]MCA0922207.1 H-NS histone family protein [Pseudooceanicola nanhaiensis]